MKTRRVAVIAAWALAAAAIFGRRVSWSNWRRASRRSSKASGCSAKFSTEAGAEWWRKERTTKFEDDAHVPQQVPPNSDSAGTLVADNELRNFTLLREP